MLVEQPSHQVEPYARTLHKARDSLTQSTYLSTQQLTQHQQHQLHQLHIYSRYSRAEQHEQEQMTMANCHNVVTNLLQLSSSKVLSCHIKHVMSHQTQRQPICLKDCDTDCSSGFPIKSGGLVCYVLMS